MQIGEENLSGAQKPNFFRLRLLHLHDHVRLGEHFGGIANDRGASTRIGSSPKPMPIRPSFDKHAMAVIDKFARASRHKPNAIFLGLDLLGHTNKHRLALLETGELCEQDQNL